MSNTTQRQEHLVNSNSSIDQRTASQMIEEEVKRLRVENKRLMDELVEKDNAVQNLFSYIQSAGA
jgi:hypothetical protein